MPLNYGDKMDVVLLCWVFSMINGDDKHMLHPGLKYKVYSPFGQYTLSDTSLVEDKGAFRALLSMRWESRGDEFSPSHLNYCCRLGKEDDEEEVATSDT